jgi:hypothetical protein
MDKLEYIPRDLVSVYVGIKKYIVEVIGTENENEALLYQIKFPNREIQYADKDNIVPIPLTPEVLEKNEWKIEDVNPNDLSNIVSKGIMYRAIKNKEILFFQKGASVFTCPLNWRKIEIKYVHELQHLLFGLGLNSEMEV